MSSTTENSGVALDGAWPGVARCDALFERVQARLETYRGTSGSSSPTRRTDKKAKQANTMPQFK